MLKVNSEIMLAIDSYIYIYAYCCLTELYAAGLNFKDEIRFTYHLDAFRDH